MSINLSVIIPHYNTFEYLSELLITIPDRDDIEVIVVDDKSEDKTELERIKNNFLGRNIIFIENTTDQKNAGICRNIGIDNAHGSWILFADSDDLFVNGFYDVVSKYFTTENDIIYFLPTSINIITGVLGSNHLQYEKIIKKYINDSSRINELIVRTQFCGPVSKLVRKSMIDKYDIRFDSLMYANDAMFSAIIGIKAGHIHISDEVIYCIRERKGSLTSTDNKKRSLSVRRDVSGRRFIYQMKHVKLRDFWAMGLEFNLWRWFSITRLFFVNNKEFRKAIKFNK